MHRALAILLMLPLLLTACGPKPDTPRSVLDSPDYHVSQGLRYLHQGSIDQARDEFNRALDLEPDFPRALSGLALVHAHLNDFDEAHDLADEAVGEDRKDPFTWATRGRIHSLAEDPGSMPDDAEDDFERARRLNSEDDLVEYWWGLALERAWDFDQAGDHFRRAIELRGPWADDADAAYRSVQDMLRASPGTRVGRQIVQLDTVTRADLAVLFLEELKLADIMERMAPTGRPPQYAPPADPTALPDAGNHSSVASDIENHWARHAVEDVVSMGVMEVAPDRRFYPDVPVSRAEYALFLQNVLSTVLRDASLTTQYIGERSRFEDMRSGTATYNAAALAVDRGFMDASLTGRFRPGDPVSGTEALLTIRAFQNHLDYDF